MSVAYPSPGRLLPLATYGGSTPPEPVWTVTNGRSSPTAAIPASSYSMPEGLDQFQQFRILVTYASAPGSVTTIEISPDNTFADAQTLTTMPATAAKSNFFSSVIDAAYNGFLRINNTSGVTITDVYIQGQVSSIGTA